MNYGKWTWEDTIIAVLFAAVVATWTLGTIWGWW
jgi:Co/Zn/Cd efflux system component